MCYLVDTNVWFWRLFGSLPQGEQQKFQTPLGKTREEVVREVTDFLYVAYDRLFVTDFSLYSIGIRLLRIGRQDQFSDLVDFLNGKIVRLEPNDFKQLVEVSKRFKLDFDDAYQYVAAEKMGFAIVSFDSDFDRTDKGRLTPGQALEMEGKKLR